MAALEMVESPDVGIIQHTSGVLRVAHNVFETGSKLFLWQYPRHMAQSNNNSFFSY
jgi:hypothetical protein